MLEEMGITIMLGLIGHTVGVVGANEFAVPVVNYLLERMKKGEKPLNSDLERSVTGSYYLSLISICRECLAELPDGRQSSPPRKWLENQEQLYSEVMQDIRRRETFPSPLNDLSEIESLLLKDRTLSPERIRQVKATLISRAIWDPASPSCYAEKVRESLFERMSLYFAFDIKHNPVVKNIFENEVLVSVDAKIERQQSAIDAIAAAMTESSSSVRQLAEKIAAIDRMTQEMQQSMEERYNTLEKLIAGCAGTLEELRLQYLLLQRRGGCPAPDDSCDAFLYIEKERFETDLRGMTVPVPRTRLHIGRSAGQIHPEVAFSSRFISRDHAVIEYRGDAYYLTDSGSKHGTRINGLSLAPRVPRRLDHGDQICLANEDAVLYFCLGKFMDATI